MQVAVNPFDVVTVIVVLPAFNAVTVPLETVATEVSLEDQVTLSYPLVMLAGNKVAVNVAVGLGSSSVRSREREVLSSEIEVGRTIATSSASSSTTSITIVRSELLFEDTA